MSDGMHGRSVFAARLPVEVALAVEELLRRIEQFYLEMGEGDPNNLRERIKYLEEENETLVDDFHEMKERICELREENEELRDANLELAK